MFSRVSHFRFRVRVRVGVRVWVWVWVWIRVWVWVSKVRSSKVRVSRVILGAGVEL